MRGNELLDRMGLISPEFIEAAETIPKKVKYKKIKWQVAAACFCLLLGTFIILKIQESRVTPSSEFPVQEPDTTIQKADEPNESPSEVTLNNEPCKACVVFNDAASVLSASRQYIPGYFTEAISEENLLAIETDKYLSGMTLSAVGGFNGAGELLYVFLQIDAPSLENTVNVTFGKGKNGNCYELQDEPVSTLFNGIYFTVYQWSPNGNDYTLEAQAEINGWTVQIVYTATSETLTKAKKDFESVLMFMSEYNDGKPDFSSIVPTEIPEYFDKVISFGEAHDDLRFGSFMIPNIPEGFSEESIRRFKDQGNDYLSGLWTKGYDDLSWKICSYNEEDSVRLTSVNQEENYDLSLYPIPRADSVPEELREIVNNPIFNADELTLDAVYKRAYKLNESGDSNGWRITFSVKYANIIIEVKCKGVSPEWIYQQLMSVFDKQNSN